MRSKRNAFPLLVGTWVGEASSGGGCLDKGRTLLRIQSLLSEAFPDRMGTQCCVANFVPGKVTLHAANGAIATRLRQMAKSMASALQKKGVDCSEVAVKVQVIPVRESPREVEGRQISLRARQNLQALSRGLPEKSLLRHGLDALLKASEPRGGEKE